MIKTENQLALEVLEGARFLLSHPDNWVQGVYFGDTLKQGVRGVEQASCMCMLGALDTAASAALGVPFSHPSNVKDVEFESVLSSARRTTYAALRDLGMRGVGIPDFNDQPCTTHEDVLQVLDAARQRKRADVLADLDVADAQQMLASA